MKSPAMSTGAQPPAPVVPSEYHRIVYPGVQALPPMSCAPRTDPVGARPPRAVVRHGAGCAAGAVSGCLGRSARAWRSAIGETARLPPLATRAGLTAARRPGRARHRTAINLNAKRLPAPAGEEVPP